MISELSEAFPFRLFHPFAQPSYFNTEVSFGGSDPVRWEFATLAVGLFCLGLLVYLHRRRDERRSLRVWLCLTPFLFGCIATVMQLHWIYSGFMRNGVGSATPFESSVFYSLFSTHLGFYGSALGAVVAGMLSWSRVRTRKGAGQGIVVATAIGAVTATAATIFLWGQIILGWQAIGLRMTEHRFKRSGPDAEGAAFIQHVACPALLPRRDHLVSLCAPSLDGRQPEQACAALQIFWSLRGCSEHFQTTTPRDHDSVRFLEKLDQLVMDNFPHWMRFKNGNGYRDIALYLSLLKTPESKEHLKEIARRTNNNEQVLICIAWRKDPADMDFLLPFMLDDSRPAAALPYHFRNSYGAAAAPFLQRAAAEAKTARVRRDAAEELANLERIAKSQLVNGNGLGAPE